MTKKETTLIILGIIFISFSLRAPITAVGSIVSMIKGEFGLTSGIAGFITTLPLISFAVVSPFVARLSHRHGYGKTMTAGLMLMAAGEIIRSYAGIAGLFAGTALIGTGIAIGNVLIPSIIKLKFSGRIGLMTSLYTTCICLSAALGAGISIPLAKGLDLGWKNTLASWLVLTLVTLLFWLPQLKADQTSTRNTSASNHSDGPSIWSSPTAWWVTLFMGIQSLIFYSLVAWLPTIVFSKGLTESFAGTMALVFQLVAIPATLVIPLLCDRFDNQRGLVGAICLLYLSGLSLLYSGDSQAVIALSVVLMALGSGGTISLAIAFISLRSPDSQRASELSGMSQSAGYLLAAAGPIVMGSIFDATGSWSPSLLISIGLILFLGICGWFAGNNVHTFSMDQTPAVVPREETA